MKSITNTLRLLVGFVLVFLFFGPYSIIMLPILALIGVFSKARRESCTLYQIRHALRLVLWVSGIKSHVLGLENIPKEPVLFISNHRSYLDMIISYPSVQGRLGFVAKQEFKKAFTMGIWMHFAGCFFLNRKNPRAGYQTILDATEAVKSGRPMWICPEGTRNHGEGLLPFKDGSFKIADKTGCPIIPVAIVNSDASYELAPVLQVNPCDVYVVFGKPINTKGLSKDELHEVHNQVHNEVLSMYNEYKAKIDAKA